ncbi:MAG: QueT transporter family protein [Clostridiales bacterium]|nr:QueT transporter family protein [Clostridiales bacterium]
MQKKSSTSATKSAKNSNTTFLTFNITQKLAISGIVIALYLVTMNLTQSFAFGQYQVRIATSLYALSAIFPFLILPLGLSNLLSNIMLGSLGFLDAFGGLIAGLLTSYFVYLIKKSPRIPNVLIGLPILLIPGLLVPIWLSYLLNLPYLVLAVSLCVGQFFAAIVGVILHQVLEKRLKTNEQK